MKAILPIILSIYFMLNTYSQQDIQVSNFDYFSSFYNPATITKTKNLCGHLIGRNQWSGFAGRPNTGFVDVSYNFSNLFWGNLSFTKDVIGLQDLNMIKLGLAKSFKIVTDVSISFGLNLNYARTGWTASYITPDTPYWIDNTIPNNNISAGNFDMDAGIYVRTKNISIGVSSTHLTQPQLTQTSFNYKNVRHYQILAGYQLQKSFGCFENFVLAKTDASSTQVDFKSNFWHNQGWMIGLAYRLSDAVVPMIGYQNTIGRVHIRGIYSYDITTSRLNQYSGGSHELCLKFCVAPKTYTERYTHPRHLGTWK